MKTVTKKLNFDKVVSLPKQKDFKPLKPSLFWRCLIRIISIPGLLSCRFTYKKIGMEKLNKKEPCLILMNHSCFLDLQIAESVMFPRPLNIVCTSDGFVGKNLLMRLIGCIPTNKFVTDFALIRKMQYAITNLKSSILMFPEATYSLYSDYYWYEIGDVICIGDMKTLYYCFPQTEQDVVTKTRIATEELFKLSF